MAVFTSLVRLAVAVGILCAQGSQAAQDTGTATVFTKSNRPAHDRILHPVLSQDADTTNLGNLLPSTNVSLNWGAQGNGLVKVAMVMAHPTVLLEEVDDISSVDCQATAVSVAFGSTEGFDEAFADWSDNGDFILVTNHLGDCDTDNERGFYLVQAITSNRETRTVVASAHRTDVNSTASSLEITFSSITVPQSKRAITLNPDGFTISNSLSLPAPLPLASFDPFVSVVANKADLTASITLSGHIKYSLLEARLSELSFDIDASASADVGLVAEVKAAYNTTVKFAPPALTFSFVNIPGIVSIGPALAFAIGADLGAEAGAAITADLGVEIPAGNAHLDFLDASKSSATGWEPKFTAEANITEKIAASIDPFAEVTVELQFVLLSGLVDLSGGITARPGFNNDFVLTATQPLIGGEKNGSTTAYHRPRSVRPRNGEGQLQCSQGLEIKSEFEFSIIAFVTQFFRTTLFHTTVPIADKCFAF
ncbi:hypothetical protein C8A05DRAFT_46229 [Staphylotrichum tortipilum]|uniref:Uncharacterized protein n=1 Tax=Staphylotrichum tortipilum TaxID=2831512 RepID=A0AAN6MGL6_9PEZI|nr:hypothetical protein C8A05DRAFT_46229 [Staphylotrichum longicolle]